MSGLVPVERPTEPSPRRAEVQQAVDVALGIAGETVGAGLLLARVAARWTAGPARVLGRPPLVPRRLQPASLLADIAERGSANRAALTRELTRALEERAPEVVEAVVARLDLTGLVTRHVDVDEVVAVVDIDAIVDRLDLVTIVERVLAEIDLPSIIRESTGSMTSETVQGARMTGISMDEAITRGVQRHLFRRRPPPQPLPDAP